jgi:hypothetical protein
MTVCHHVYFTRGILLMCSELLSVIPNENAICHVYGSDFKLIQKVDEICIKGSLFTRNFPKRVKSVGASALNLAAFRSWMEEMLFALSLRSSLINRGLE